MIQESPVLKPACYNLHTEPVWHLNGFPYQILFYFIL
uniref:Uncharacterized protein n=1 Tax=Rhizophora mucronata TaxID=61149 RepID=A0A2P2QSU5_RHIMU